MDNHEWFKQAGYGMMVHWGLYSLLGGQYGEQIVRPYAEWIQAQCAIPIADYSRLAGVFNPIYFDADEWIRLAKDCGMKYFVITSKHHDGFAMFHSRVDKYNVVDATPFGRDVVGELANACAMVSNSACITRRTSTGTTRTAADTFPTIFPAPAKPGITAGTSRTKRRRTLICASKTR